MEPEGMEWLLTDDKQDSDVSFIANKKTGVSKKTVVVLGAPRGGTSMISGLLRELGVFMGANLGENHEDPAFLGGKKELSKIRETIEKRNNQHDLWGWKVPHSIFYINEVIEDLRNPYFIIVYRNIVSVALSQARRSNADIRVAIRVTQQYYKLLFEFMQNLKHPVMLINYELACAKREMLVDEISNFLEINPSPIKRERAINFIDPARGYKQISSYEWDCYLSGEQLEDKSAIAVGVDYKNIIVNNNNHFEAVNNDPQIIIQPKDGACFPDNFFVSLDLKIPNKNVKFIKVYVDFEGGFSDNVSTLVPLQNKMFALRFTNSGNLHRVRIDPMDVSGKFELYDVKVSS